MYYKPGPRAYGALPGWMTPVVVLLTERTPSAASGIIWMRCTRLPIDESSVDHVDENEQEENDEDTVGVDVGRQLELGKRRQWLNSMTTRSVMKIRNISFENIRRIEMAEWCCRKTWKQFIETVDKRMLSTMADLIVFGKKHQETENGSAWGESETVTIRKLLRSL
ncbi:hypothetical protein PRIPAC_79646 [Pristionchus pacificus]|uniref:Uncharacterized protein n=1 Tax=Pristionchus pacificus TaxID=54126 RepID=A0A2A6CKQ3_PRIPA|nr:hypothetical protein PRIPAC_79646 [Pristionchus pacificus]|eukprot:PDM78668.1 hypothetical protein PRIPAC_31247 [Pristionchus pacificus]